MKRIADDMMRERLETSGAVLIEGPRWCGKTRTATELSKSRLCMQDLDKASVYLKAADTKPSILLKGEIPRLIDEWQIGLVGRCAIYGRSTRRSRTVHIDRFFRPKRQRSYAHWNRQNFKINDAHYESIRIKRV